MTPYLLIQQPSGMHLQSFGGVKIFRPRPSVDYELAFAMENHLRSQFRPGTYTSSQEINDMVQHLFRFYQNRLANLLPHVASRDFTGFMLHQFDCAAEIDGLARQGRLSTKEAVEWLTLGPTIRRAIKYIIECMVQLRPSETSSTKEDSLLDLAEKVLVCAEEMVNLYIISDQTFHLFPNESTITIHPQGEQQVFTHELTRDISGFHQRVENDVLNRHRFIEDKLFVFDVEVHEQVIGTAFKESTGISYRDALKFLALIIQNCKPAANGFPVPFMHRHNTISSFAGHMGIPAETAFKIVDGFSISKGKLESEGTEIFKPKREYRAYRRAFFEFPHASGEHFTFSKSMAREALTLLIKEAVFTHVPAEWTSNPLREALGHLSNGAGKWFERVVEERFRGFGYSGVRGAKTAIGIGPRLVSIPTDVGEIDYIGYSRAEGLLVVVECKLVQDSFEPRFFRDDLEAFVRSDKAFVKKFRKKMAWIRSNISPITQSMSSYQEEEAEVRPARIAGAIITLLPCFASYFIDDFPCVSITELCLDRERLGAWPYDLGVFPI